MKTPTLALFFSLLLSPLAAHADTIQCMVSAGLSASPYSITIPVENVDLTRGGWDLQPSAAIKIQQGVKQIGSIPAAKARIFLDVLDTIAVRSSNGGYALRIEKQNSANKLNVLVEAEWTQPKLGLKKAKAVCVVTR